MAIPTQEQFNDIIEQLADAVEFYNKTPYRYNQIRLNCSNGKILDFEFHKAKIAHLLGINVQGFKTYKILSSTDSYGILEELIERSSYVYRRILNGEVNYFDLFSKYMIEKIRSFKHILQLPFDDIEFVCEYNAYNAYLTGKTLSYPCEYYLVLKNNESYEFLGFKYDEKICGYVPTSTLNSIVEPTILQDMISNQRIMMVSGYSLLNIDRRKFLVLNEKRTKMIELAALAKQCGAMLDVSQEAIYLTQLSKDLIIQCTQYRQFCAQLESSFVEGTIMPEMPYCGFSQVDEQIHRIMQFYNDTVESLVDIGAPDSLLELRNMRQQLSAVQKQMQDKDAEIATLKASILQQEESFQTKITEQQETIQQLETFHQDSFQLYKKYFKADE